MLKKKLFDNSLCLSVLSSITCPVAFEQLILAGYDFIIVDIEHTLIDLSQMQSLILTARARSFDILFKLNSPDSALVCPLLDAGATGLVFAMIETQEQAERAVEVSRYSPLGKRGLNSTYDSDFGEHSLVESTYDIENRMVNVVMIESQKGVDNIQAIAGVEGIDMIMVGSADLSQTLGYSWQTSHPLVLKAIEKVANETLKLNKTFCAIPRNKEQYIKWKSSGISNFLIGDDRSILRKGHKKHLSQYIETSDII